MKFKLYIEYNGTNYSGWQKQGNAKTIQGTLIKAINEAFAITKGKNKFIDLQGSGRTDAGVHAIEQVAHLECETMLAPEIIKLKLNDLLPSDINILEIEKVNLYSYLPTIHFFTSFLFICCCLSNTFLS